MGLQGLFCGCFAMAKANGDVLPQVPQALPSEAVLTGNTVSKRVELLPEEETAPPCTGCVAKDSVNSIAIDGASRADLGAGYHYGMTSTRGPLSSRALVGGVEYKTFFVNPLAEGSHEGGVPIKYAGAAALGAGVGHNNPLAAEYSDDCSSTPASSAPNSPPQIKIRALPMMPARGYSSSDGGCGGRAASSCSCGGGGGDLGRDDGACPAAPGTPLQRRKTVTVIGVTVACETACSEHLGSLHLPSDAAQCFGKQVEEEKQEVVEAVVIGLVQQRASMDSGCGFDAGGGGGEAASGVAMAGQEEQRRSTVGCSAAEVGGTEPPGSFGAASEETTTRVSPRWRAGVDGSSGGGPCGAVRLPSTPELSPASGLLLPQTPLSDAEPIGRRVGSEIENALAEQHESDIEEGAGGDDGSVADPDAADAGADAGGSGIVTHAAFAPCTPPLVARDAATGGGAAVATSSQSGGGVGGRESRLQSQAADRDRSARSDGGAVTGGGGIDGEMTALVDGRPPELRSASSTPSPPRVAGLEATAATEPPCLVAALMQARSVPMEGASTSVSSSASATQLPCDAVESALEAEDEDEGPQRGSGTTEAAEAQPEEEEEAEQLPLSELMPSTPEPLRSDGAAAAAQQLPSAICDEPPAGVGAAADLMPPPSSEQVQEPSSPLPPAAAADGEAVAAATAAAATEAAQECAADTDTPAAVDAPFQNSSEAEAEADAVTAAPQRPVTANTDVAVVPADDAAPHRVSGLAVLDPSPVTIQDPDVDSYHNQNQNSMDLDIERASPDLRKAFNSCGGHGGRNSTCSSCEIPAAPSVPPVAAPAAATPLTPQPPAGPPRRRAPPMDSISGLTMTRLLIRQLGLLPPRPTTDELPTSPSAPPTLGRDDAADVSAASPFAAAVDAATAALAPAALPPMPDVRSNECPMKSRETASVTFALALPYGHAAAAAVAPAPRAAAVAVEVAVAMVEPRGLVEQNAASCIGGGALGTGLGGADDLPVSVSLTRESSSVFEERSSYSLYGVASSRSIQGWLEPQGWKPLRERYGTGGAV